LVIIFPGSLKQKPPSFNGETSREAWADIKGARNPCHAMTFHEGRRAGFTGIAIILQVYWKNLK
jgi:hypothetical protein